LVLRTRRLACSIVSLVMLVGGATSLPAQAQMCPTHRLAGVYDRVPSTAFTEDADTSGWRPWVVQPDDVMVPAPPATESAQNALELAEVQRATFARTDETLAVIRRWDEGAAVVPWTRVLLDVITANSTRADKNPPRISRDIALIETATFDALRAAFDAKACYRRLAPYAQDPAISPAARQRALPSYPSEHATVAGVMEVMMPALYGVYVDDMASEALESRIAGGVNFRSDVDAGRALGRKVAQLVLAARASDGSANAWDGSGRIVGTCNWSPTPPAFKQTPLEASWGKVTPWLMSSSSQARPQAPPACDSPEYLAAIEDLYRSSLHLTDRQKQIAQYWAGGPGTETPPGMNLHIALDEVLSHNLTSMRAARVLAHVGAAMADAAIAAWDAKFTYWGDRPVIAIRRLYDPAWNSLITTPPFPGYVSGHASFSGASSSTLSYFFPEDAVQLKAMASEAAISRFYGGIHVRYDNEVGLQVGELIGGLAAARAAEDDTL
jgi:hypothetical protein